MRQTASRLARTNPVVGLVVGFLVVLWTLPTFGLLVTSFRTPDQIATAGWWRALFPTQSNVIYRTPAFDAGLEASGSIFEGGRGTVAAWGISSRAPEIAAPGETVNLRGGERLTVQADGSFTVSSAAPLDWVRGQRIFARVTTGPSFTLGNYHKALLNPDNVDGMLRGFIGTASIAIPSTIIPIMIAAFAAYALAWMRLPWRRAWLGLIIGLLVVPLQLSLIPVLQLFQAVGLGKSYLSVLLAHTGFGLPLAIFLLYNYISQLPGELIASARVDGATDFQIFRRLVLPLSVPALASFAIFQFLWTWNDLLVARVFFVGAMGEETVMTAELVELMGSRGGDWEILATSAFISMIVPLCLFFALQRYLVRGLLAGSLK